MIQLIVGHKGSGKTKAMVEMANKAVKESKGYVVVIEKDVRLTYEISSAARLVYSDEYAIAGYDAVYGFITGLLGDQFSISLFGVELKGQNVGVGFLVVLFAVGFFLFCKADKLNKSRKAANV